MTLRPFSDIFEGTVDAGDPIVAGQAYTAKEPFIVTIPAAGGPYIDANGKTYANGANVTAFFETGGTAPADPANITTAEFLLMSVTDDAVGAGADGDNLRVEIPVGDSSIVSANWSVTDVGFDLTSANGGRLVLESGLGELEIELPMVANKTYYSGAIRANEAWQIRSQALAGSSSLRVAAGYTAANGGSTTLTRIWHYKEQKEVVDPNLVEVEDADVVLIDVDASNNTFYSFSTGETWAAIKANYENLRFDINMSRSGTNAIRSNSLIIDTSKFDALVSQPGYWLTSSTIGVAVRVSPPDDTDTGFTYAHSNGDAPTSGRMQFRVTGVKKKRTVVSPDSAELVLTTGSAAAGGNVVLTAVPTTQNGKTLVDASVKISLAGQDQFFDSFNDGSNAFNASLETAAGNIRVWNRLGSMAGALDWRVLATYQ